MTTPVQQQQQQQYSNTKLLLLGKLSKMFDNMKQNRTTPGTTKNTENKELTTKKRKYKDEMRLGPTMFQCLTFCDFTVPDYEYVSLLPKEELIAYNNEIIDILQRRTIYFNSQGMKFIDGTILEKYYKHSYKNEFQTQILYKLIELLFHYNRIMIIGGIFETYEMLRII